MKRFSPVFALLLALCLALPIQAQATPDLTGLWKAEFYGNQVECHLEQRGMFLFGKAVVHTATGEKNTYTLAGLVLEDGRVRASHGSSGNYFEGAVQGADKASGTFHMVKSGHAFAMQAQRVQRGKTYPGGLEWPPGFGPAQ